MGATTGNHIDQVLGALRRVERVEGGWIACCPLHADHQRSLRIAEHANQVFVRCASRCQSPMIARFIEALVLAPAAGSASSPETFALPAALVIERASELRVSMAA